MMLLFYVQTSALRSLSAQKSKDNILREEYFLRAKESGIIESFYAVIPITHSFKRNLPL